MLHRLFNVTPFLTIDYLGYLLSCYSIFICQNSMNDTSASFLPYCSYERIVEDSSAMLFSISKSAFLMTIHNVIRLASEKQMCGVATRWIVALMQHVAGAWVNPIKQKISHPTCCHLPSSYREDSIACRIDSKSIRPTFRVISFCHSRLKNLSSGNRNIQNWLRITTRHTDLLSRSCAAMLKFVASAWLFFIVTSLHGRKVI
jgi:hypothetical protein